MKLLPAKVFITKPSLKLLKYCTCGSSSVPKAAVATMHAARRLSIHAEIKYPCEVRMEDGAIVVIDRERAERVAEER